MSFLGFYVVYCVSTLKYFSCKEVRALVENTAFRNEKSHLSSYQSVWQLLPSDLTTHQILVLHL